MDFRTRNLVFWVVVGLLMIFLFNLLNAPTHPSEEEIIFSDFMNKLDKGEIAEVTIKDNHINGVLKDGTKFKTYTGNYPDLVKALREKKVRISYKPPEESPWYRTFFVTWGPFILFLALWVFFVRRKK